MKIQVCEDERLTHEWLARALRSWGHTVVDAYTGAETLHLAASSHPDVILLDFLFPDMGGAEVLKSLRANEETKGIPVIAASASDVEDVKAQSKDLNVTAVLKKPIKTSELKALLDDLSSDEDEADDNPPVFVVIDRSGVHQKVIERILKGVGCRSLLSNSIEEALVLIRNVRATGIIVDIAGDEKEAIKVLSKLRGTTDEQIPIIALTTVVDQQTVRELFKQGVTDILVKPIVTSRLSESIRNILKAPDGESESEARRQRTILVVEDFTITAHSIERLLEPLGYRVIIASSGFMAFELIQRQPPDLMLLDVNLPGMNGIELVTQLQDHSINIPFAVVSAEKDKAKLQRLRALGATNIFKKPIDRNELIAFVTGFQNTSTAGPVYHCDYQILLALADGTAASIIEQAIEEAGLSHKTVTDGYQALSEMRGQPPVAIIDIVLGGLDGSEVIRRTRSEQPDHLTRILCLAQELDDEVMKELKELGADDALGKPFNLVELIKKVRNLMAQIAPIVELSEFAEMFMAELNRLPNSKDDAFLEHAKRLGHNLVGSAGLISSDELLELGRELKQAAENEDLPACESNVEEIRSTIEQQAAKAALSKHGAASS